MAEDLRGSYKYAAAIFGGHQSSTRSERAATAGQQKVRMDIIDPGVRPIVRRNEVETDHVVKFTKRAMYKLTYYGSMNTSGHTPQVRKMNGFIKGFSSSPGIVLDRFPARSDWENETEAVVTGAKRPRDEPEPIPVYDAIAAKFPVLMNLTMASALFAPAYVDSVREMVEEVTAMPGVFMERPGDKVMQTEAEKPAVVAKPPPSFSKAGAMRTKGKLVFGVGVTNYSHINKRNSNRDYAYEEDEDGVQLVGQIYVKEVIGESSGGPPMQCTSAPVSDILALLGDESVRTFVSSKCAPKGIYYGAPGGSAPLGKEAPEFDELYD